MEMKNSNHPPVFGPAGILLPEDGCDLCRWASLACDQFTSQPEYWREAEEIVGDAPSTLRMMIPEVYLEQPGLPARITGAHAAMRQYAQQVLRRRVDGYIYVERIFEDGTVRQGLVGQVDLEAYSYQPGAEPLVRPSENTVLERIPPRLAVRRAAPLESPHIIMLVDDSEKTLIEAIAAQKDRLQPVYDTPLMLGGGQIRGWAVTEEQTLAQISAALAALGDANRFARLYGADAGQKPFVLAVGDGNHSLATAKAYWEEIKQTISPEARQTHPARWCLAELENIQSPAIEIEPIHRAVFGVQMADFLREFEAFLRTAGAQVRVTDVAAEAGVAENAPVAEACGGMDETGAEAETQVFVVLQSGQRTVLRAAQAPQPLAVGTLEAFLQQYQAQRPERKVDYIHGEDTVEKLAGEDAVGVLLPPFEKSDLFRGVALGGVLPKKTFSMGHATQKRYYLECRRIEI